jgi:ubiquinone/menaquinone biosynthesis C-methylase UbiE
MDSKLIDKWQKDEKAHFEGWDFSYLKNRLTQDKPPWDYVSIAKRLIKYKKSLLDIDTGGGEVLLSISNLPKNSFAVEGYHPNVKVARRHLKKHGIKVIEADSAHHLPFKNDSFDVILNRHGAINAKEIYRVLRKDGIFITQQVDAKVNFVDLIHEFNEKPKWVFNNLSFRKKELSKLGFKIIKSREWRGKIKFRDVGAIVYLLKTTPWLVDNFSVRKHLKYLIKLQNKIEKKGKLTYSLGNFLIVGRKR